MKLRLLIGCLLIIWSINGVANPVFDKETQTSLEQAFQLHVFNEENNKLRLEWDILPGYFLYRDQIRLLTPDENINLLSQKSLPSGIVKTDNINGSYQVYQDKLSFPINTQVFKAHDKVIVYYQGCKASGLCFAPILKELSQNQDGSYMLAPYVGKIDAMPINATVLRTDVSHYFDLPLKDMILKFLFIGCLLFVTASVLPTIPIALHNIFHLRPIGVIRTTFLSSVYIITVAVCYAGLGLLVAKAGDNLHTYQTPKVIFPLCAILILMALTQYSVVSFKIFETSKQGSMLGSIVYGVLATLIIAPSVNPPFIDTVAFLENDGNLVKGMIAFVALGIGMGLPILVVNLIASFFSRFGNGLVVMKDFTGVLLTALTIWLLETLLAPAITLFMWGLLFLLVGIYIGAFDSNKEKTDWRRFWRGVGVLLALYGLLMMVLAFTTKDNMANPFTYWIGNNSRPVVELPNFHQIKTVDEMWDIQKLAQDQNKPMLMFFCSSKKDQCKSMSQTLSSAELNPLLNNFEKIQVDVGLNLPQQRELFRQWRVNQHPLIIIANPQGHELVNFRTIGMFELLDFKSNLSEVLARG